MGRQREKERSVRGVRGGKTQREKERSVRGERERGWGERQREEKSPVARIASYRQHCPAPPETPASECPRFLAPEARIKNFSYDNNNNDIFIRRKPQQTKN